jgi:TIR domain
VRGQVIDDCGKSELVYIRITMDFDVFISHASEDKDNFVRLLAQKLEAHQVSVWYDEFTLKPGSSLRRSIDLGLSNARLGIVILSDNFFKKRWTNWELDGLVARQNASENDLIIPIWLDIIRDQLLAYSPSLADKVAIQANLGIDKVVSKLLEVIKPAGSTLVIARDLVFKTGIAAPMVTDDWWLDVVEYSGKEYLSHEYLAFDIPLISWEPQDRGEYTARHALQKLWQEEGEEQLISQLTPPEDVLEFIEAQPGLKEVALEQPKKVAFFFPQLAIRGFGGFLEPYFEKILIAGPKHQGEHLCEEEVALRHTEFGNYSYTELAGFYFTGAGGGIGPPTARHDYTDFIIWLISEDSSWLPPKVRYALLEGLKQWAVWDWGKYSLSSMSGFERTENSDALGEALFRAKKPEKFKLTKKITVDLKERIAFSKNRLNLSEEVGALYDKFISEKIIEAHILAKLEIKESRKRKRKP